MSAGELTARIIGSGSSLPATRLDNFSLYEVDAIRENFDVEKARGSLRNGGDTQELSAAQVFDLWSRQVTGIRERRIVDSDGTVTTESLCADASRRALEIAGMEARDLDLIIVASLTASEEVPNVACTVGSMIGAPAVGGYVLNAACAGFIYALATGFSFIKSGTARRVLVVSGDSLSHIVDYSDPKTAVLFGDGAGAVVLEATTEGGGILGQPYLAADYSREHMNLPGQWWARRKQKTTTCRWAADPRCSDRRSTR